MSIPVLVTRPGDPGKRLAEMLSDMGKHVLLAPALRIEWQTPALPADFCHFWHSAESRLIFPSRNAVEGLRRLLDRELSTFRGEVVAVGPATADALRAAGVIRPLQPQRANSESLLEMPALQAAQAGPVWLITAPDGRALISPCLRQRGFELTEVQVYRRQPCDLDPEIEETINRYHAVDSVFTSAMGLQVAFQDWPESVAGRLRRGKMVVVSARLAAIAGSCRAERVGIAENTSNEAIVAELSGAAGG